MTTPRVPVRFSPRIAPVAARSAARCAAYGVLLRVPLKPTDPAEPQETVSPFGPAMVMWVLLNVALMWTTPRAMFFLTLRFVDLPMIARLFGGSPLLHPLD